MTLVFAEVVKNTNFATVSLRLYYKNKGLVFITRGGEYEPKRARDFYSDQGNR